MKIVLVSYLLFLGLDVSWFILSWSLGFRDSWFLGFKDSRILSCSYDIFGPYYHNSISCFLSIDIISKMFEISYLCLLTSYQKIQEIDLIIPKSQFPAY